MALSLPSERTVAAASPANPFVAILRWIAKAQAARTRRAALKGLLDFDREQFEDLGISRSDVTAALAHKGGAGAHVLNAARARNARR
ncbi:hypothetical protein WH87_01035 [Devosia epidermidihirudinis]|uniref:DUF1127 domain-containing protein n=1 Tax=Devosia epidermidihirudinis TaxID=1293439 RepID=A0A0F5QKN6_9HYPH|nr:hypothetical protein [Devosia epidermidihirudinis]KKC41260.1 hypothetical protein WH87_01020 [Devosia epidermidihirudinis]KKC41263.1 hypothetical protein WH87_01035 [Devosia epidermidihirudinis]